MKARRVNARDLTSKREVATELAQHGSGYVLGAAVAAGVALRRRYGRALPADGLVAAVVIGMQPFVEWGLHKLVLHAGPRQVGPVRVDLGAAHRGHHRVPDDVAGALLGPGFALADATLVAVFATGIGVVVGGRRTIGTAVAAGEGGLLAYEWSHLLAHSGYRPRTAWFRRLRASHLRHHFRDETSNFGITSRLGDRLFSTAN